MSRRQSDSGIGSWGTAHGGPGHNAGPAAETQWQVPHRIEEDGHHHHESPAGEPDFDLVEASFVEGFQRASDPTSFLRLAGVPFHGCTADGRTFDLLRVEQEQATDVAVATPHMGGEGMRVEPMPARMVSHRRRLRLVYLDGGKLVRLTLEQARTLRDAEAEQA